MKKLLDAYRADNEDAVLAKRIRTYERSHPMARCCLSLEDDNLLNEAIQHANRETP